eukprot:4648492-Pleurochrysis_carterae.AAC.1
MAWHKAAFVRMCADIASLKQNTFCAEVYESNRNGSATATQIHLLHLFLVWPHWNQRARGVEEDEDGAAGADGRAARERLAGTHQRHARTRVSARLGPHPPCSLLRPSFNPPLESTLI